MAAHPRLRALEAEIKTVKRQLAALGELRPGSLSQQYNVCGSPGCQCKASPPQKHGPYYQLSYTRKGKDGTRFVKQADLPAIREAMANYTRLRDLVDPWIDLATEVSDLTTSVAQSGIFSVPACYRVPGTHHRTHADGSQLGDHRAPRLRGAFRPWWRRTPSGHAVPRESVEFSLTAFGLAA